MCSRKVLSVWLVFFGVFLFLAAPCCFAQSNYSEIEIYRALVEKENRDSSYHKVLAEYRPLSTSTGPSVLQKQLSAITLMPENTEAEVILKIETLEALAQEAARKKDTATELSALSEVFTIAFWHEPKNYSKAFLLAIKLKDRLTEVDDAQFAGRRDVYVKLGEAYYIFKDYAKSIELLANVIDKSPLSFGDCSHLEALRISGICYANTPGGMPQSDSCFMAMMLCPDVVLGRPVYDALALSNLGCNAMMQGDFDKALALDLEVLPLLKQEKDYGHIAGMYACQGECYLGKGDYGNLRMVIDSINSYAHRDVYNRNKRLKQAFTLSGKYYSGVGDARTAQLYNDSLVALYKTEEMEYTSQFISDARREIRDQEIGLRKHQIAHQKNLMVSILVILTIISMGTVIIIRLYSKRNVAYKVLARQAEMWAREEIAPCSEANNNNANKTATEKDLHIMAQVEREMTVGYAYRDTDLTMDSLAVRLGIGRHLLSQAINHVTCGNFKQYVNGYRIKEAVRIISQNGHQELYIDEIYERVGFSNRTTFYRAFKQLTGLSPIEFQKNHNSSEKKDTF